MPDYQRDPARIQTWNLLIRSQILYSVKLRGLFSGCKDTIFDQIHKLKELIFLVDTFNRPIQPFSFKREKFTK